ncbi:serine/threonine-protein kinase [Nonomuraea cavernae]|uniref:non-specific serine/threonine protein kinase n=1 Tax=Nonomuraea cavernae TaxID=2045107 RepID=A0A917Z567_9ACTN|nr:serine/threonine-protein kinase [Nonomuraea cavernae]MCA2188963.1 serine/threonine protein kinase [Nonomuraea cavernae]GGO75409.1 serine/threonine protein kinase [Nonomuraea cavernae]
MSDRKRDGRRIAGRYQLQEPIGKGGMGIVWRAHDELLDRVVAVKEVRYAAALGDEVQLLNRRTMREARAAARFEHPNVIVVHDVIEEDDRPWIVMQLVPSRSLGAVIKQDGPLPPKKVAEIGLAVLDALHRAHESGVLHRDVKPENVLLADDGRVVLTDFGIATLETETQLTVTGLAGTPAFIAPERLKGLPARRESDLWSLGATLYTSVEGRSPHERGMALATMHAVLTDEPDPAPHAGPLAEVISGLLAKEPVQRPSYEETSRMLREVIAQASPPPTMRMPAQPAAGAGAHQVPAQRGPAEDDTPTDPDLIPPAAQPGRQTPSTPPETGARLSPATGRPTGATGASGATVESGGSEGRRLGPIIAAACAVVLVAGVGGYLGLSSAPDSGADSGADKTHTSASSPPPAGSPSPSGSASPEPTPSESASTTPTASSTPSSSPTATAALPSGWKMYKDKTGFSIGLPKGWKEYNRNGSQVFFRGPGAGSNAFLMIEEASDPGSDPYKDWKKQEPGARGRFGGYKLIDIHKVDYMKAAADWDFTWNTNTGKTRVRNRGFLTENGRGYAIYWHNLNSRWKKDKHFFDTFAATFKPAK